jgi:hypothetical protein
MIKETKYPATQIIFLCFLLVIIVFPRFNRQDIGFQNLTGGLEDSFVADDGKIYDHLSDARCYLELVKYFRDFKIEDKHLLTPPYCYRPLPSFLASFLPFNEMTSLNILNVLFLIGTLLILERIISKLNVSHKSKFLALTFFVVSFPTFFYGTIGYIDPAFLFFLSLGFYLLIQKKWILYILFIFIGTFAKEGIVILIPISIISIIQCKFERKTIVLVATSIIAFLTASIITRILFNNGQQYVWIPSYDMVIYNITRFRTLFSILITFSIPGIISLFYVVNMFRKSSHKQVSFYWHLLTGVIFSTLFCFFGIITVSSDGRYIWPLYVFSIPFTALYLEHLFTKYKKQSI